MYWFQLMALQAQAFKPFSFDWNFSKNGAEQVASWSKSGGLITLMMKISPSHEQVAFIKLKQACAVKRVFVDST